MMVVEARGRTVAVILVALKDRIGTLTFHGKFDWLISQLRSADR